MPGGTHGASMSPIPQRLLAIDVGAGTTDVLVWEQGRRPENSEKLVAPSRTVTVARRIDEATGRRARVVFRGPTMGGGACTVTAMVTLLRESLTVSFAVPAAIPLILTWLPEGLPVATFALEVVTLKPP